MRTSGINSLDSAFLLDGELPVESDNYDSTTWLDFLDIPVESSVGSFPSLQQANENSRMIEKMGIEIPHDKDTGNPAPAEIFEVPRMSLIPVIDLDCKKTHRSSFGRKDNSAAYFDYGVPQAETSYRQRMRWTPELHDLFLEAVKTLGGLENATPKKILGIMNVVGLNIDQVKSHLQKCRLAKNLSDQKHDRKASSVEKNAACLNKDSEATSKSDIEVLESLNIQIEAQKLLHEQIEAQRELQLRIQQNVELLKKLMEEQQQNAIPKPIHDVPTSISNCDQLSPSSSRPVINYCSASQPSTHEATKNHLKSNKRLRGEQ
ncbi:hypothetical protein JCGZ_19790 [Jatropha curcas]|uniref:HTH myb-type domain-containing protein n=1 Tax=Jatropha curcas TaxID=180498 RepID=A0A067JUY9_JATCU|nr:hypothetical protein JCGZ_19790 [Jatropha curcas]